MRRINNIVHRGYDTRSHFGRILHTKVVRLRIKWVTSGAIRVEGRITIGIRGAICGGGGGEASRGRGGDG